MAEESSGGGVPEWVVTFGDMMSLLLTFFIMLVSFSELKSEEKYQALMDAFQEQFGYHESRASLAPGQLRPRNSALAKLASLGRAKRAHTLNGGAQPQAPVGDNDRVKMIRPGHKTGIGTVLYFHEEQIDLDEAQRAILRQQADLVRGKPQKLEIRGHTSNRVAVSSEHVRDNWDLSFQRCRRVMQYLVEEQQIEPRRLRISAAASNEPVHTGTDLDRVKRNPRVELYLLDEVVEDTTGTEDERARRFATPATRPTAATNEAHRVP